MKNDSVREYYDILKKRRLNMVLKRLLDIILSLLLIIILSIPLIVITIIIKCDSKGPAFFKQTRVTTYGKEFKILKFRTMVVDAEKLGGQLTQKSDPRVTKIGKKLRKYRIDELPQAFNVLSGSMSLVGTRPEVPKYVKMYTDEMYATLLMPAGVTSTASALHHDEESIDSASQKEIDYHYMNVVLPKKMEYNLEYIKKFSVFHDIVVMFRTIKEVF